MKEKFSLIVIRIRQGIALCRPYAPCGMTGVALLGFTLLAVWSTMFKLDVLVRGPGVVRVESHNIVVQHADGGQIEKLLVREGQTVRKGQLLAVMDNTYVSEEFARNSAALSTLRLREQRLEAELAHTRFDPAMPADAEQAKAVAGEKALYDSRQLALDQSASISQVQADQRLAQSAELRTRIGDLDKEVALMQQQVDMIAPLVRKGAAAEGVLLQKRSDLQSAQSALNEARAKVPRLVAEEREYRLKVEQIKTDFMSDAQKQLSQARDELAQVNAKASASQDRRKQAQIESPADGVIQRVVNPHAGAVVRPGGDLFEIAPTDVPLVAQVRIRPEDRDKIWQGMPARVHVNAFGNSYADTLDGRVAVVSADALGDDRTGRFYEVTVEVPKSNLKKPIYPGMAVESYLLAGHRSLAQYLLKPLMSGASAALSES
ncbi:HlyD family type I secretion periplasmic adaptor subunit [Paraburkholderia sp. RL17-337-BIB-A]|uniref:HlyD family type I secretion periplasmic adaptor subunit n=1 Tax=Paraburkholderia sp. RL17-337-BIB-A TaxID=3031636 RepID=UPI0038B7FCD0